jgi:hypothetical protein
MALGVAMVWGGLEKRIGFCHLDIIFGSTMNATRPSEVIDRLSR